MKTIEKTIRENISEFGLCGSEYIINVQQDLGDSLRVYIRPYNRNGETVDFVITGNEIKIIDWKKI